MKKIRRKSRLVSIVYNAISDDTSCMDAEGYAFEDDIIVNPSDWYFRWENEYERVARQGYKEVKAEDGNWGVVSNKKIYTEVVENDSLSGGYGRWYPGGGMAATTAPEYVAEYNGEEIMLDNDYWG